MNPLNNISPKEVRTNLAWLRNFVQQKYGPEVLFFGVIVLAFSLVVTSYFYGIDQGKEINGAEVKSLKTDKESLNFQVKILKQNNEDLEKEVDSVKASFSNSNLTKRVEEQLREAEKLKNILQQQYNEQKNFNDKIEKNLNP